MARISDLQSLPRFSQGWTFLYVERVRIERDQQAIVLMDKQGRVPVPAAALAVLLLGPGATITHAAVMTLADCGCSIAWCGEGGVRFYAAGLGETRRGANLYAQAEAWAAPHRRLDVVMRMYRMRFNQELPADLRLEQIRGMEGVRVREAYARASRETGIAWSGRSYKREQWDSADPINRALSAANACLYGLCHAATVTTGYSPALGFIHTGKMLSFVYDVADLYKCDVTVPIAFRSVLDGEDGIEARVRRMCRDSFFEQKLLERIVPDIQHALGQIPSSAQLVRHIPPEDDPGPLWDPETGEAPGGVNYGDGDAGTGGEEG